MRVGGLSITVINLWDSGGHLPLITKNPTFPNEPKGQIACLERAHLLLSVFRFREGASLPLLTRQQNVASYY